MYTKPLELEVIKVAPCVAAVHLLGQYSLSPQAHRPPAAYGICGPRRLGV